MKLLYNEIKKDKPNTFNRDRRVFEVAGDEIGAIEKSPEMRSSEMNFTGSTVSSVPAARVLLLV